MLGAWIQEGGKSRQIHAFIAYTSEGHNIITQINMRQKLDEHHERDGQSDTR